MNRTDLAMEAAEMLSDKSGIKVLSRNVGGVRITDVRISGTDGKPTKRAGRYITLEGEPYAQSMTGLLRRALEQLIPKEGRLLAAGLGNPDVTYDAFGAFTVRSICAGKGRRFEVSAIETDVAARTGIETAALIRAASGEICADCIIAVDSLACRNPHYIGRTVQITDAGITPGSGVGGDRAELSVRTTGVPTVVIGVPTMTELSAVTRRDGDRGFAVTTVDINVTVRLWAETAAAALNELTRLAHSE